MTEPTPWQTLTRDQKRDLIAPHITAGKLTYTQIAAMFGTTRNAISSTVARTGIVNPLTIGDNSLTPMQKAEKARMLRAQVNKTNTQRQVEKEKKQRAAAAERKAARPPQPTPDHRAAPAIEPVPEVDRRPPKPDAWLPLGPPAKSIPLDDLTEHTCHWPVTPDLPFLFCGQHTTEGKPYCPTHAAMAYRAAPPITVKKRKGLTNA